MASTTSRRGWASGRPPAAGVLVDLLVWLPKSLPGALFAAQTARHPAVTATVQPSAKAAQPTGSETGTKVASAPSADGRRCRRARVEPHAEHHGAKVRPVQLVAVADQAGQAAEDLRHQIAEHARPRAQRDPGQARRIVRGGAFEQVA